MTDKYRNALQRIVSAVSRLCTKLGVLALARMIGHRDLKMLLRHYSDSADKIAERLT